MEKVASRKASQNCLNAYGPVLPELLGGSADLAGSNLTIWSGSKDISGDNANGNYIYYGVREFGMSAIMNGIALHGGFVNYGATFLMFMEYARNAVRMSALMGMQSIFVYTHDSIGLGEDGPTHQPVEQLSALRSTPNLHTWRPCDTVESAVAGRVPSSVAMVLVHWSSVVRVWLPCHAPLSRSPLLPAVVISLKTVTHPQAILIATGSEVELAVAAAEQLAAKASGSRCVHALCRNILRSGRRLPRCCVDPSDSGASCGGSTARRLLVQVCRSRRPGCGYDQLW